MRTLINILRISIILLTHVFSIQAQELIWSNQAGGTSSDMASYIVTDKHGNSYVGGGYCSSPIFFNTASYFCRGLNDLFVVKYDQMGNELWSIKFGGNNYPSTETYESLSGMAIDSINNRLLIVGAFYDTLNLPDTMLSGSGLTVFILALDFERNILWARNGGGSGIDIALSVCSDLQGNIYVTGINQGSATFETYTIPRGGFLAKYTKDGNLLWVKNKFRFFSLYPNTSLYPFTEASPYNSTFINETLIVNGNVTNDTIVIDTISIITSHDYISSYLSAFSSEGNIKWLRLAGGPQGSCGSQVSNDRSGNIYITGLMGAIGIFNQDTLHSSTPYGDCFMAKYTSTGDFLWARNVNPTQDAWGWGVISDRENNVYCSGTYSGTIHFGNTVLTSGSLSDMFLAKYTSNGTYVGVMSFTQGRIPALAMDNVGNICFAGFFAYNITLGSNIYSSRGSYDIFIAKSSPITGIILPKETTTNTLLIYANPNTGQCRVTIPEEFLTEKELTLTVYDQTGQLIQEARINITGETVSLDIRARAKGLYHAILSNGKKSYSGKIVFD